MLLTVGLAVFVVWALSPSRSAGRPLEERGVDRGSGDSMPGLHGVVGESRHVGPDDRRGSIHVTVVDGRGLAQPKCNVWVFEGSFDVEEGGRGELAPLRSLVADSQGACDIKGLALGQKYVVAASRHATPSAWRFGVRAGNAAVVLTLNGTGSLRANVAQASAPGVSVSVIARPASQGPWFAYREAETGRDGQAVLSDLPAGPVWVGVPGIPSSWTLLEIREDAFTDWRYALFPPVLVEVRVIDEESRRPVIGVEVRSVSVAGRSPVLVLSDDRGVVSIQVPDEVLELEFRHEGYATVRFPVIPGIHRTIVMAPEAVVVGRVVRSNGSPASFADISVLAGTADRGVADGIFEYQGSADSNGEFSIGSVPPGEPGAVVVCDFESGERAALSFDPAPGRVDLGQIALAASPTLHVLCVAADGQSAPDAHVTIQPFSASPETRGLDALGTPRASLASREGVAAFPCLYAGAWQISVRIGQQTLTSSVTVPSEGTIDHVVQCPDVHVLQVHVADSEGVAVAGATVIATGDRSLMGSARGTTDVHGEVVLSVPGVPTRVMALEGWFDDRLLRGASAVVERNTSRAELTMSVRTPAPRGVAVAVDGSALSFALIYLVDQDGRTETTRTDDVGRFDFRSESRGPFYIVFCGELDSVVGVPHLIEEAGLMRVDRDNGRTHVLKARSSRSVGDLRVSTPIGATFEVRAVRSPAGGASPQPQLVTTGAGEWELLLSEAPAVPMIVRTTSGELAPRVIVAIPGDPPVAFNSR